MKTKKTFTVKNLISNTEYTYLSDTAKNALIDCVIYEQKKVSNLLNTELRNKIESEIETIISKKENTIHYFHEETNLIITVYQLNNETMKTKETFFQEIETKTNTFFNSLSSNCDIAINDYINIENIIDIDNLESFDSSVIFESITELLQENNAFNLEIIYYSNAIDFLKKYDPSLNDSLEIASEYCFELQNLNSEILASLLYSQIETENFYSLESEITDFFSDIETEINDFLESTEV